MSRPTYMTINTAALQHNIKCVQQLAPHSSIIAMVKADAYGHGIERVAQALDTANALGVASLEEALKLRESGIKTPIVLMEGVFHQDELIEVDRHNLSLVVHHLAHVEMLQKTKLKTSFPIWLKINTGMNRLGIPIDEVRRIYSHLLTLHSVQKPIGLMTHFAEADHPESDATLKQIALFQTVSTHIAGPYSLANSAAILAFPNTHADWVRPGLMLYGASPFNNHVGLDHGLEPVMTLWSRLIAINPIKKGSKVGYGGTWIADEDLLVGVVGVGYGDGYPQFAQNGTPVLVNNKECNLIGRVSMDMLTVDLRHQPNAQIGDRVVLWGDGLPVERIAHHSQTSAYEILTRMTPRPKIEIRTA